MTTLPDKLIYPKPFAGGAGAVITPFSDAVDGDKVNFETGFPDAYSAPKTNGGKFVTRGEMNYLGNIATKNDYYRMCGGINTFDPVFASKIGGYPKDAILDYFDGVNLFKVISLEEDNMVDFRSGVFGGKWAKLGTNETIQGKYTLETFTDYPIYYSLSAITQIQTYIAPKSGVISISISAYSKGRFTTDNYSAPVYGTGFLGRAFPDAESVVLPSTKTPYTYNGFSVIGGLPTDSTIHMVTNVHPISTPVVVQRGDIFVLCYQSGKNATATGGYDATASFTVNIS